MKLLTMILAVGVIITGCGSTRTQSVLEEALNSTTATETKTKKIIETRKEVQKKPVINAGPALNPEGTQGPAISQVLFPNGKENLYVGRSYTIRWEASGFELLNIEIQEYGRPHAIIATDVLATTGNFTWIPDASLLEGESYKKLQLALTEKDTRKVLDSSDEPFLLNLPKE